VWYTTLPARCEIGDGNDPVKRKKTDESLAPNRAAGAAFMTHATARGRVSRPIADLLSRLEKTFEDAAAWITRQP
jgi:hypothetical protein